MFKPRKNDSEHHQLYEWGCDVRPADSDLPDLGHDRAIQPTTMNDDTNSADDSDMSEISRHLQLSRPYETYMLTERNMVQKDNKEDKKRDPMNLVVKKIQMGLPLTFYDYRTWMSYNYLCFAKAD